jgi:cyclophilin family peptidyl-prolyl cis-trans isomerase
VRRFLALLIVGALALLPGCGSDNPIVVIDTSMGPIKVELYESDAPITVKNFLKYVDEKHYDNTIFHRVMRDFMIQGGGTTVGLKPIGGTNVPIKNESYNGLSNSRGTIAMARTNEPNSATDEFFINVVDNAPLNRKGGVGGEGYCVFGKVIDGMDVVDRIRAVPTKAVPPQFEALPIEPVIVKSIRLVEAK